MVRGKRDFPYPSFLITMLYHGSKIMLCPKSFGSILSKKGHPRVEIIIANPVVISSSPPEFRDKKRQGM